MSPIKKLSQISLGRMASQTLLVKMQSLRVCISVLITFPHWQIDQSTSYHLYQLLFVNNSSCATNHIKGFTLWGPFYVQMPFHNQLLCKKLSLNFSSCADFTVNSPEEELVNTLSFICFGLGGLTEASFINIAICNQ